MGKLLIIDNENSFRENISEILTIKGYEVVSCPDGQTALNMLPIFNPDLIICDILMPEMDGFEFVNRLRMIDKYCRVPVIYLTALDDIKSISTGFNLNAVDYITKPFNSEELLLRINNQLILKLSKDALVELCEELTTTKDFIYQGFHYAQRLQASINTSAKIIDLFFPGNFIFYKPKNYISGDFYFINEYDGNVIVALADCTGHGIGGALLSMIGYSGLIHAIIYEKCYNPQDILERLQKFLVEAFKRRNPEDAINESMDIAICTINKLTKTIKVASCGIKVYLFTGDEVKLYSDASYSLGDMYIKKTNFLEHGINYNDGDHLYMLTDGFGDQFGGANNKKFSSKREVELLTSILPLAIHEQKKTLINSFYEWKGRFKQTDDVSVIGLKL